MVSVPPRYKPPQRLCGSQNEVRAERREQSARYVSYLFDEPQMRKPVQVGGNWGCFSTASRNSLRSGLSCSYSENIMMKGVGTSTRMVVTFWYLGGGREEQRREHNITYGETEGEEEECGRGVAKGRDNRRTRGRRDVLYQSSWRMCGNSWPVERIVGDRPGDRPGLAKNRSVGRGDAGSEYLPHTVWSERAGQSVAWR